MGRELFIYWRVAGEAAGAEAAVRRMQHDLRARLPGLVARLYRRLDSHHCTLMETYALPDVGIDATLQRDIETTAAATLAPWCAGSRHVEAFEDCA